jgi:membrane protein implicated in regulation of membrane protease activity
MTWADSYLLCFFIGFGLSALSLFAGGAHVHVPHLHMHFDAPHAHLPHFASGDVPVLSLGTIAAFLAWFGGTGYLLVRFSSMWVFFSLGLAGFAGFAGAGAVFLFLAKVLMRKEENLNPADYDMVGVLGHLSIRIRKGGTGEIVFAQAGTRHCAAARSEDSVEIPKGTEVVVTRYEKGVAYVQRWDDLAGTAASDN